MRLNYHFGRRPVKTRPTRRTRRKPGRFGLGLLPPSGFGQFLRETDALDVFPDAPDWNVTQRRGYAERLAADDIELVAASRAFELPPVSGGAEPDQMPWLEEPTDADWDRLREESRMYPDDL